VHKLILNSNDAGKFSKKDRITCFKGELYMYTEPQGLEAKVQLLIDRYNDLLSYSVKKDNYKLFKACGFLVFELLDLHPFSDGNGRLCRLLANYILSTVTPFPTSIYIGDSNEFIQCLINARKSKSRHPKDLTRMIIECNYYEWKRFLERTK
jgi:Fic family protein